MSLFTANLLRYWLTVIIVFGSMSGQALYADILSIPDSDSTEPTTEMPSRGMTMDDVTVKFGKPLQVIEPVGTPPITRWIYENFTVHFEYEYVILAVKNRKSKP